MAPIGIATVSLETFKHLQRMNATDAYRLESGRVIYRFGCLELALEGGLDIEEALIGTCTGRIVSIDGVAQ